MNTPQKRIIDLLSQEQPLLSLEFFPPKSEAGVETLVETAKKLKGLDPDFVSVTFGAGGSTRDRSATVCARMKNELELGVMPHLTCVGSTKDDLREIVQEFYNAGYRNIMTLRGDPPKGETSFTVTEGGFAYASDLVAFIKEEFPEFSLGVAGYPEKHPEAASLESDIDHLKIKIDAGASFITTQLFFDNEVYFRYMDSIRSRGIDLPVIPGIMPVLDLKQIKRIAKLCDSKLPSAFESKLDAVAADPEAVRQVGVEWAKEQMLDLVNKGAPGVHLYALNKSASAFELMSAFRALYPAN